MNAEADLSGAWASAPMSQTGPSVAELYRLLTFAEERGGVGGSLIMYQPGSGPGTLPFAVRKVLFMSDLRPGDVRGRHAHFQTQEVLVCLQGGCTVDMEDGLGRQASVRLERKQQALLLYPHVWRTLREFEEGTLLLVIADAEYDERDYIRDRASFEAHARRWTRLGGRPEQPRSGSPGEGPEAQDR